MRERFINWLIKFLKADTNKICDGYHTFEELYEHRIELWIALIKRDCVSGWRSKKHSDGSRWKGWFIAGLGGEWGRQITYHLPMKYWNRLRNTITYEKAPPYDGHTPKDVIMRLQKL